MEGARGRRKETSLLAAEWIHFTLVGIILPNTKLKLHTLWPYELSIQGLPMVRVTLLVLCGRMTLATAATDSSDSSDSSTSSASTGIGEKFQSRVFPELNQWTWLCKRFRARFRRGLGRSLLSKAFKKAGLKEETQVLGPSATRFFVHSVRALNRILEKIFMFLSQGR